MTPCRQQRASTLTARGVPPKLPVPRAYAVVVINFSVVQCSEQSLVQQSFGCQELIGKSALETDTDSYSGLRHRFLHTAQILWIQANRFFKDQVFAGRGRAKPGFCV